MGAPREEVGREEGSGVSSRWCPLFGFRYVPVVGVSRVWRRGPMDIPEAVPKLPAPIIPSKGASGTKGRVSGVTVLGPLWPRASRARPSRERLLSRCRSLGLFALLSPLPPPPVSHVPPDAPPLRRGPHAPRRPPLPQSRAPGFRPFFLRSNPPRHRRAPLARLRRLAPASHSLARRLALWVPSIYRPDSPFLSCARPPTPPPEPLFPPRCGDPHLEHLSLPSSLSSPRLITLALPRPGRTHPGA